MYVFYNPNPFKRSTSDCVVRAITKLLDEDWDSIFLRLSLIAFEKKDNLEKNHVWGDFLKRLGFKKTYVLDDYPYGYTVRDFCMDHPVGRFLLRIDGLNSGHVVAVVDGDYYDSWDSGDEIIEYFYY